MKLEAVFQTSGRIGLDEYSIEDVEALISYWQAEENRFSETIEAGEGTELDLMLKQRLVEQLEEVREYVEEREPDIDLEL